MNFPPMQKALEMMSSETQLQSPSSNTIPPPSATISAAMDDINETLDPDAVLEGVEVLDSDEIFAQGVLVESCVAGLDAELVVHHLQQTSSSGASNQRFVDQMRDLCEKYEVELDLVYKEHGE